MLLLFYIVMLCYPLVCVYFCFLLMKILHIYFELILLAVVPQKDHISY